MAAGRGGLSGGLTDVARRKSSKRGDLLARFVAYKLLICCCTAWHRRPVRCARASIGAGVTVCAAPPALEKCSTLEKTLCRGATAWDGGRGGGAVSVGCRALHCSAGHPSLRPAGWGLTQWLGRPSLGGAATRKPLRPVRSAAPSRSPVTPQRGQGTPSQTQLAHESWIHHAWSNPTRLPALVCRLARSYSCLSLALTCHQLFTLTTKAQSQSTALRHPQQLL